MLLATAFASSLERAPPGLRRRLRELGADRLQSLSSFVAPGEDVLQVWYDIVADGQLDDADMHAFFRLHDTALALRGRHRRASANRPLEHLRASASIKDQEVRRDGLERLFLSRGAAGASSTGAAWQPPAAPPRPPRRARTALGVTCATATGGTAAGTENALREKYLEELADVLLELDAPVVRQVGQASDVRAALKLTAGGRRARTLRTRLRGWRAFARWLGPAKGERYPTAWSSVLEYAQERAREPCGRQSLLGLFWAVAFIERAGGYGDVMPMTKVPLYQAACREVLSMVSARAGGLPAEPAARPLVAVLAMFELAVTTEAAPAWLRAFAFWKLLQCWCTLRHDDHRGFDPSQWTPSDVGYSIQLHRTKTTGPGKKVARRPVGLAREAYLVAPQWAEEGMRLWQRLAPWPRDYLLVAPDVGLEAAIPRELTYGEAAGWSRAWYHRLCEERGLACIRDRLGAHYTEHSGRHWLPSVAFALGAPEDELEVLGGWSAKPSRSYLDTAASRMMTVQTEVAQRLRSNAGGSDVAGEAKLLNDLANTLTSQGLTSADVEGELAEFRFFPGPVGPPRPWHAVEAGSPAAPADVPAPPAAKRSRRQESEDKTVPIQERGYVVSLSPKTGFRRLHFAGACHRVPGVHYAAFEWLGSVLPTLDQYDDYCAKCWPLAPPERRTSAAATQDPGAGQRQSAASSPAGDELDEAAERSEASEDDSSSTDAEAAAARG